MLAGQESRDRPVLLGMDQIDITLYYRNTQYAAVERQEFEM